MQAGAYPHGSKFWFGEFAKLNKVIRNGSVVALLVPSYHGHRID